MKPARAYRPLEPSGDVASANRVDQADEAQRYSRQITLREIFTLTTLVAICCAFFVNFREDGVVFAALVIFGNLLGVGVGLMVTHIGGLPTDGSNPVGDAPFDDEP